MIIEATNTGEEDKFDLARQVVLWVTLCSSLIREVHHM
jgi:hypothetical protein